MDTGFYYAELEMQDTTKYYSEEFWVDGDSEGREIFMGDYSDDFNDDFFNTYEDNLVSLVKYTKLTWWHKCDIGNLLYQTGYVNMLYIDSNLIKLDPEILEEGKEDGEKNFIPSFIKLTDNIEFSDIFPDHIINALEAVSLHDYVFITTKKDGYIGKAKKFSVVNEWISECHGKADVKFQQETVLLRGQCCGDNTLINVNSCPSHISLLQFESSDNGDGTSDVTVYWQVDLGAGPYRVMSPQVSGGAPHDTIATTYLLGAFAHGSSIYVTVVPICTSDTGRFNFGNTLTLSITVP
jgi:hypothetical protein